MEVETLVKKIEESPELRQRMASDPIGTLRATATPLQSDPWIYRVVVLALGFMGTGAIVGSMILAFMGKTTPEVVTALGSAAVGALAGLLAPSPMRS